MGAVIFWQAPAFAQGSPPQEPVTQAPPQSAPVTNPPATNAPAPAAPAMVDDANTGDIIVTANRQASRLQETPLAVSAINGSLLAERHVTTALDIAAIAPSVQIGTASGQARIAVRGIGYAGIRPGDEGRIAFYVNDVYISRPSAQLGAFFDVDRVEVVRGPQGTLYGRNATGGAISIVTRKPTDTPSGYLDVSVGNYAQIQTEGAISGPITDTLSARVAFSTLDHDGYGKNLFTGASIEGAKQRSVRASLLWKPADAFDLTVVGDYSVQDDTNIQPHSMGLGFVTPPPGQRLDNSRDVLADTNPTNYRWAYGISGVANYRFSSDISAKAIVAYRESYFRLNYDNDATTSPYTLSNIQEPSHQFSAELQLLGKSGRLNWVVGAYYFHENTFSFSRSTFVGNIFAGGANYVVQGNHSYATLVTDARAIFAQATYKLTDALSITLGGRYSNEDKSDRNNTNALDLTTPFPAPAGPGVDEGFLTLPPRAGFPLNRDANFQSFTPKATIDYKLTRNIFAYATYSKGFKSGGFSVGVLQPAYAPETLDDYEIGLKTQLFDRRVTLNLSGFIYNYSNIQTSSSQSSPPGVFTVNSGRARIKGVEAEFTIKPVDGLQFDGSASYLDATFVGGFSTRNPNRPGVASGRGAGGCPGGVVDPNSYCLDGNRIPFAPEYTLNLGAQYTVRSDVGSFTLRGEYNRIGTTYYDVFQVSQLSQPAYGVGNLFLNFENTSHRWTAGLFARNVGNVYAVTSASFNSTAAGGLPVGYPIAPRTFGARVGYKF